MTTVKKIGDFKVGRPIKYFYEEKLAYLKKLVEYINTEEYPTMPKFCRMNHISKQRIYEWAKDEHENGDTKNKYPLGEYFRECVSRMNDTQESFVEENAIKGNINVTFSIFKLKQLGWRDSPENILINSSVIGEDIARVDEKLKALLPDNEQAANG
ncbi:MAG: hypothetical protein LBQ88_05695 [Treponema sp.]|jgi:hypothetical protein|nr:hypothetical protein [Treponema sp.]